MLKPFLAHPHRSTISSLGLLSGQLFPWLEDVKSWELTPLGFPFHFFKLRPAVSTLHSAEHAVEHNKKQNAVWICLKEHEYCTINIKPNLLSRLHVFGDTFPRRNIYQRFVLMRPFLGVRRDGHVAAKLPASCPQGPTARPISEHVGQGSAHPLATPGVCHLSSTSDPRPKRQPLDCMRKVLVGDFNHPKQTALVTAQLPMTLDQFWSKSLKTEFVPFDLELGFWKKQIDWRPVQVAMVN